MQILAGRAEDIRWALARPAVTRVLDGEPPAGVPMNQGMGPRALLREVRANLQGAEVTAFGAEQTVEAQELKQHLDAAEAEGRLEAPKAAPTPDGQMPNLDAELLPEWHGLRARRAALLARLDDAS